MFSMFKRTRTPKEDFYDALLSTFSQLKKADQMSEPWRGAKTASLLASLVLAIREVHPHIPISPNGPAVSVISKAKNPAEQQKEIDHILQQVRTCPRDKGSRVTMMVYFLNPEYYARKLSELGEQPIPIDL